MISKHKLYHGRIFQIILSMFDLWTVITFREVDMALLLRTISLYEQYVALILAAEHAAEMQLHVGG